MFNIGSGWNYSVNTVFDIINRQLNAKISPLYGERLIEPAMTLADCSKAVQELGWRPSIDLEDGIVDLLRNVQPSMTI